MNESDNSQIISPKAIEMADFALSALETQEELTGAERKFILVILRATIEYFKAKERMTNS